MERGSPFHLAKVDIFFQFYKQISVVGISFTAMSEAEPEPDLQQALGTEAQLAI